MNSACKDSRCQIAQAAREGRVASLEVLFKPLSTGCLRQGIETAFAEAKSQNHRHVLQWLLHVVTDRNLGMPWHTLEIVQSIKNRGGSLDTQDMFGYTPLHKVACTGQTCGVQHLLNHGASPNSTTAAGASPLHLASLNGHTDVARELINWGALVNTREEASGYTPLHHAASRAGFILEHFTFM